MRLLFLFLAVFLTAAGMSGCAAAKKPLKGKRISVFALDDKLSVVSAPASLKWNAPAVRNNSSWPQFGGNASHALQHLSVDGFSELWRIQVGGVGVAQMQASPIVVAGRIFVLDGRAGLHVFDVKSGKELWQRNFALTGSKEGERYEWSRLGFGGGLAFARGRVFVATGFGTATAVNANTGDEIWRHEMRIPFRSAPVVDGGQVYFLSFNNRLSARDALSGREVWSHQGISESGSLLETSAVAVSRQVVIAPYNSGEVYALRARDKGFVWTDNISGQGGVSAADNGFIAIPAVDRNRVYVVSHAGTMVAINLANGERLWSQDVSGVNMPWIAGDRVFVLGRGGVLSALSADQGKVIWRKKLPAGDISAPVIWHGPILAGGALLLTSSQGRLARVDPKTGKLMNAAKLAEGFLIAPVIADRKIFLLSTDMELIALGAKKPKL